jgi:hypothetical protein
VVTFTASPPLPARRLGAGVRRLIMEVTFSPTAVNAAVASGRVFP